MAYGNGGTAMAGAGASINAARSGMVTAQIERQAKGAEQLIALISELEMRLSGVTRPDSPSPSEKASQDRQALVPFANSLYDLNDKIEGACGRLQSLLNRVEL